MPRGAGGRGVRREPRRSAQRCRQLNAARSKQRATSASGRRSTREPTRGRPRAVTPWRSAAPRSRSAGRPLDQAGGLQVDAEPGPRGPASASAMSSARAMKLATADLRTEVGEVLGTSTAAWHAVDQELDGSTDSVDRRHRVRRPARRPCHRRDRRAHARVSTLEGSGSHGLAARWHRLRDSPKVAPVGDSIASGRGDTADSWPDRTVLRRQQATGRRRSRAVSTTPAERAQRR